MSDSVLAGEHIATFKVADEPSLHHGLAIHNGKLYVSVFRLGSFRYIAEIDAASGVQLRRMGENISSRIMSDICIDPLAGRLLASSFDHAYIHLIDLASGKYQR